MLRIALDLSGARDGPTGRGTYVRSLLLALAAVDRENRYFLYGNPSLRGITDRTNFRYRPYDALEGIHVWHFPDLVSPYLRQHASAPPRGRSGEGARVVTVHDLLFEQIPEDYPEGTRRAFAAGLASAVAGGSAFLAPSEWTAAALLERGVPRERVRVVPLAVAPTFSPVQDAEALASLRRRYGLDRPYLLYVGGAFGRKNLARTVLAYRLLRDRKRVDHALVAAGITRAQAQSLLNRAPARAPGEPGPARDEPVYLGLVPESDMPLLYSAADLALYPSLAEGFGLPVLEAMACGVPVVTSATSALTEVAGDAALLVDPREPEEIAAAVARLLSDRSLYARLRQLGLERARGFTWDRVARETLGVYQAVRPAGQVTFVQASP